jgi:hypothetical protein
MPYRLLIVAVLAACLMTAVPGVAWASDNGGQYGAPPHAGVSVGPGTVQVGTGDSGSGPSGSGSAPPHAGGSGSSGATDPNAPYGCTYTVLPPAEQTLLGVGGQTPGQWEAPECRGPGVIDPCAAVGAPTAQPPPAPVVNPAVVGQQAVSELVMPTPTIGMAPPAGTPQLVNVAAWLWIDPGAWQGLSATATAGPVTATATATPVKVVWDMGDGAQVSCDGPGTPYSSSDPMAATGCSYTWSQAGSFQVTATVYWQVSWTATGAPGGGDLGVRGGPAGQVAVVVEESEAINTSAGG